MRNQTPLTISSASTVFGQIILFLICHGSRPLPELPPIGRTNLLFEPYFYGGIFDHRPILHSKVVANTL